MNRIRCAKCRDLLHSKHQHDFVKCRCGAVSTDGGDVEQRWIGGQPENVILVYDDGTERPLSEVTK